MVCWLIFEKVTRGDFAQPKTGWIFKLFFSLVSKSELINLWGQKTIGES